LLEDVPVQSAKTGMLLGMESIEIVQDVIKKYGVSNYVLDPIIRSSSGFPILQKEEVEVLKKLLLPLAALVTPNIYEAERLTGMTVRTERDMERAAQEIQGLGPGSVLVKGGHLEGPAVDVLYDGAKIAFFRKPRLGQRRVHGAGCVLSSAIVAGLAKGLALPKAVQQAKAFVFKAIREAVPVGQGRLPLHLL
jgi:hydroxymethylpyrimidine/phosphomethylpyrimidine kinase